MLRVFTLSLLIALLVTHCSNRGKDVVAIVNGEKITRPELMKGVEEYKQLAHLTDINSNKQEDIEKFVLDQILTSRLLVAESKQRGITVSGQELQQQITTMKKHSGFDRMIKNFNLDETMMAQRVEDNILIMKLIQQANNEISFTDDEVQALYEKHKKRFSKGEQVHARHILLKVDKTGSVAEKNKIRQKLQKILVRARKGETFPQLAKKYSQGPSAKKGGDLGFFSKGDMVPEFDKVVFALKKSEISNIVETKFGFHIIKLEEKRSGGVQPFEKVRSSVESLARDQKSKEYIDNLVEGLKEKAEIEILL